MRDVGPTNERPMITRVRVYVSLPEHTNEGFVWLKAPTLPQRSVVRLGNPSTGESAYCEVLQIDENFQRIYNSSEWRIKIDAAESAIVMNQWYRKRLGLQPQQDYSLEVDPRNRWFGRIRACMQHPQNVVRVAVWLGVISVATALVGLVLGAISLCR
jgi:hypothetical protein